MILPAPRALSRNLIETVMYQHSEVCKSQLSFLHNISMLQDSGKGMEKNEPKFPASEV